MTENDALQSLYDHKYADEVWKPLRLNPDGWSTSRYDDIARLLRSEKGRLLDVGCGAGQLVAALSPQFDEMHGVDISRNRILLAQRAVPEHLPDLAERCTFRVARADEPLPYDEAMFDVVIASAVLEHVVDLFQAVDELARVCRPGGCVVVTVPNICYLKHVAGQLGGKVPLTGSPTRSIEYWREHGWDGGHFHYFSKEALGNLLLNAGFVPEAWTGDGKLARLRRWYQNFVGNLTVRARRRMAP